VTFSPFFQSVNLLPVGQLLHLSGFNQLAKGGGPFGAD
jgi:hypothetical protein